MYELYVAQVVWTVLVFQRKHHLAFFLFFLSSEEVNDDNVRTYTYTIPTTPPNLPSSCDGLLYWVLIPGLLPSHRNYV